MRCTLIFHPNRVGVNPFQLPVFSSFNLVRVGFSMSSYSWQVAILLSFFLFILHSFSFLLSFYIFLSFFTFFSSLHFHTLFPHPFALVRLAAMDIQHSFLAETELSWITLCVFLILSFLNTISNQFSLPVSFWTTFPSDSKKLYGFYSVSGISINYSNSGVADISCQISHAMHSSWNHEHRQYFSPWYFNFCEEYRDQQVTSLLFMRRKYRFFLTSP